MSSGYKPALYQTGDVKNLVRQLQRELLAIKKTFDGITNQGPVWVRLAMTSTTTGNYVIENAGATAGLTPISAPSSGISLPVSAPKGIEGVWLELYSSDGSEMLDRGIYVWGPPVPATGTGVTTIDYKVALRATSVADENLVVATFSPTDRRDSVSVEKAGSNAMFPDCEFRISPLGIFFT